MSTAAPEPDPDKQLKVLSEDAGYFAPDLFAVYGVRRSGRAFLGWGIDFHGERGAIYYDPYASTTHYAGSAKDVLNLHNRLGTAGLEWLDDD